MSMCGSQPNDQPRPSALILFTNSAVMVFDQYEHPMPELNKYLLAGHHDLLVARDTVLQASRFYIARFNEWQHPITKDEMLFLLGVHKDEDYHWDTPPSSLDNKIPHQ